MSSSEIETPMAMRPGYYNAFCDIQRAAIAKAMPLLPSYAGKKEVVIVDYGCAHGLNSIPPLKQILSTLPNSATATIHFEDTALNDFNALSKTINAYLPTLRSANNQSLTILASMLPTGFFSQVLPSKQADLGVSWSAFSYLSSVPQMQIDPTASPADFVASRNKAYGPAAHNDLIKILTLRAAEIKKDGHLVIAMGGSKPAGATEDAELGVMPLQAAMMRLAGSGKLAPQEMMQFALWPSHERTLEEVKAALETDVIKGLWEVEVLEAKIVPHPAWEEYQAAQSEEGLRRYGHSILSGLIAASGWYWVQILKKSRGEDWDGGDVFLDELVKIGVDVFVAKFEKVKCQNWYNYLRLRRK